MSLPPPPPESSAPLGAGDPPLVPPSLPDPCPEAPPVIPPGVVSPDGVGAPPVLSPFVRAEPPLPPPASTPAAERLPLPLKLALSGAGIAVLGLAIFVRGAAAPNIPYQIGSVLGFLVLWPALLVGLFSLGRRFRTPRRRATIVLWVWSLGILGILSEHHLRRRAASRARPAPTTAADVPDLGVAAAPTPPPTPARRLPASPSEPIPVFDYSPGSDTRLAKVIEESREDRYHAVVAGYAAACAARPNDAVIALERVRFIDRFAYAEDSEIESAGADRDVALAYLNTRFPRASGTVLYHLERTHGAAFDTAAREHLERYAGWPMHNRARFAYLLAQRAWDTGKAKQAASLAQESFYFSPSVEAGLLAVEANVDPYQNADRLRLLDDPVFEQADPWARKRKMELLFDHGATAPALALYAALKETTPAFVHSLDIARRLAKAGAVDAGRQALAAIRLNRWNRDQILRQRFTFELEYGDAAQAGAAYRALRATGFAADPLLRDRFTLLLRHPGAGWSGHDVLGALALFGALGVLVLAPALLLLPVHYWSILRSRRSPAVPPPVVRWHLRDAWVALALLLVGECAALWYFQPQVLRTWWTGNALAPAVSDSPGHSILLIQGVASGIMALVVALALWRAQAWGFLGRGSWRIGQLIHASLAVTLGLRIFLLAYANVWPESLDGDLASLSPQTRELCLALLKSWGPAGLIVGIAVVVPLLEELIFRGILLDALAKHIPFGWANLVQATLFALLHENLRVLPFFVAFGVICGFVTRRAGGLLPAIVIHACNNLLACFGFMALHRAGG